MKLDNLTILREADEAIMDAIINNRGDLMALFDAKEAVSMWIQAIREDGDDPKVDDVITNLCRRINLLTSKN